MTTCVIDEENPCVTNDFTMPDDAALVKLLEGLLLGWAEPGAAAAAGAAARATARAPTFICFILLLSM